MRKRPRECAGDVTDRWANGMERVRFRRRWRREGKRGGGAGEGVEGEGIGIFLVLFFVVFMISSHFSLPLFDIFELVGPGE